MALKLIRQSPNVLALSLSINTNHIAKVRFTPPPPTLNVNTAYINSIDVKKQYQNRGIGAMLLTQMNNYLMEHTSAKKITGVLWDDNTDPFLSDFFFKNGYFPTESQHLFYDDGIAVFDIIPIERKLY